MVKNPLIIGIVLCLLAAGCCLGASYQIVDLGIPSWAKNSWGTAINDAGQIIGDSSAGGFIWDAAGGFRNLNLGGEALAINNHGQVTGYGNTEGAGNYGHAFLWSPDTGLQVLGGLGSDSQSWGRFITDDGHVFGQSSGSQGIRLFEWDTDGGIRDLGVVNVVPDTEFTGPVIVTQSGQLISSLFAYGDPNHAFVWDAANGMRDLGPGFVYAANSRGVAVGNNGVSQYLAAMWDTAGVRTILGTLPGFNKSEAYGVNDAGVVVGTVRNSYQEAPFVWENGKGMSLLPTLGAPYAGRALGINSAGVIVGASGAPDGSAHAVLWVPVPEPSSLLALGMGVLGLAGALRRRRR